MSPPNVFRSKIDWWLILLVVGVPSLPRAIEWVRGPTTIPPVSFWILMFVLALVVIALVPIRYVIEGRTVSVQCGMLGWEYVAFSVEEVQSVRSTHNPLASPALSLDRLRIELGFRGNILISPQDKAGFLSALEVLDPDLRHLDGSLVRVGT
jgi:Bacterial PH domain